MADDFSKLVINFSELGRSADSIIELVYKYGKDEDVSFRFELADYCLECVLKGMGEKEEFDWFGWQLPKGLMVRVVEVAKLNTKHSVWENLLFFDLGKMGKTAQRALGLSKCFDDYRECCALLDLLNKQDNDEIRLVRGLKTKGGTSVGVNDESVLYGLKRVLNDRKKVLEKIVMPGSVKVKVENKECNMLISVEKSEGSKLMEYEGLDDKTKARIRGCVAVELLGMLCDVGGGKLEKVCSQNEQRELVFDLMACIEPDIMGKYTKEERELMGRKEKADAVRVSIRAWEFAKMYNQQKI